MTLQGPQQHWLEKTRRIERAWGKETFLPGTSHSSCASNIVITLPTIHN